MNKDDNYNEILHWLAYRFPGIYRIWTDDQNQNELFQRVINSSSKKGGSQK